MGSELVKNSCFFVKDFINVGDKEEIEVEISVALKFFAFVFLLINAFVILFKKSVETLSSVNDSKRPVLIAQPNNLSTKLTIAFSGNVFIIFTI